MLTWLFAVDVLIAAALLLLGLIVIVRNSYTLLHRVFFFFTFSLAAWIVLNYLSNVTSLPYTHAVYANRLTLFFPALVVASMLAFVAILVNSKTYKKYEVPLLFVNGLNALLALTPLIVSSVSAQENVFAITFGAFAPLYFGVVLLNVVLVIAALLRGIKTSVGKERSRLVIIFWSILGTVLITLVTNAALPLFTSSFSLTNVGPLSAVLIAAGLYYSIAKHQLFDIRPVIARAAGYVLTIATLATVYGVLVFGIARLLFNIQLPLSFEIFVSVATGIAALSFHKFKRMFDRVTNKLFYQDAYDPQELFDEYNKILVSTIDLDILLKRSSNVILKHLKSQYCDSIINEESTGKYRTIGAEVRHISPTDISKFRTTIQTVHQAVIIADDIPNGHDDLQELLTKYEIAVLVRLTTNLRASHEGLGYIALGPKKSGNAYTSKDVQVLETLANELIIALQNSLRFEEIERFNETLQQRIEDATRKLKISNEKLRLLNETKDDFIGMASHQLRTPLTSVKGYLSLVIEGDAGRVNATQKKLLTQAFVSSQRMVYLIADLLNVSRLRTGKFVVERTPTNIATMISDELGQLREVAASRGVELTYQAPADFPILPLDETKTRQVIMNFMDNAIYYTPSGGHVRVELTDLPKSVELRVIDDGIGVPKHEHPHLFTKFYRAKNAQRARPDGTGLGLFMAKKVIVAQGGATIFNSKEGEGSTFGFSFPKDLPTESETVPALPVG